MTQPPEPTDTLVELLRASTHARDCGLNIGLAGGCDCPYRVRLEAADRIASDKATIERQQQQLAAVDLLVGDGFAESVHEALDRAGAPRKEGPITFGIVQRIERLSAALAGLNQHVEMMQQFVVAYLVPETYVAMNGMMAKGEGEAVMRDKLFIADMIYLLDGPEQRAAQNPAAQYLSMREGEE